MPRKPRVAKPCDKCKRKIKKLKKYNGRCEKWIGKHLCSRCYKNTARNPFFIDSKYDKYKTITRFELTDAEKRLLHQKFMNLGCSSEEAWRKVNFRVRGLRYAKMRRAREMRRKAIECSKQKQEKKQMQEKFVEGLK